MTGNVRMLVSRRNMNMFKKNDKGKGLTYKLLENIEYNTKYILILFFHHIVFSLLFQS